MQRFFKEINCFGAFLERAFDGQGLLSCDAGSIILMHSVTPHHSIKTWDEFREMCCLTR